MPSARIRAGCRPEPVESASGIGSGTSSLLIWQGRKTPPGAGLGGARSAQDRPVEVPALMLCVGASRALHREDPRVFIECAPGTPVPVTIRVPADAQHCGSPCFPADGVATGRPPLEAGAPTTAFSVETRPVAESLLLEQKRRRRVLCARSPRQRLRLTDRVSGRQGTCSRAASPVHPIHRTGPRELDSEIRRARARRVAPARPQDPRGPRSDLTHRGLQPGHRARILATGQGLLPVPGDL